MVSLVVVAPLPVAAHNHREGTGGGNSDGGTVTVTASTTHLPVGSEGSDTSDWCSQDSRIEVYTDDDFAEPITTDLYLLHPSQAGEPTTASYIAGSQGLPSGTRLFSPTGQWFRFWCGGSAYLLPAGGPAVNIPGLVEDVMNQLDPPDPPLAITPDHGRHVVNMPSWFAIDPAYWAEDRTARAEAGRVVVEASLGPTQIQWEPGDGQLPPPCTNPGTVWRRGLDEGANDCPYIYELPSLSPPANTWELSATITFEVENFFTNAPGTYGPWDPVERTSAATVEVVEIQAVGSSTP